MYTKMCTVALSVTTFCHFQHPCSVDPVIVYVHYKSLLDFDLVCAHLRVFVCQCVLCSPDSATIGVRGQHEGVSSFLPPT